MATLRAARQTYKGTGVTSDAWFVRIERQDGTIIRYTNAAEDVPMDNRVLADASVEALASTVTYYSASGYNPTAIAKQDGLQPGMIDLEGILDAVTVSTSGSSTTEFTPDSATASSENFITATTVYEALITQGASDGYQWWPDQGSNASPEYATFTFNQPVTINRIDISMAHNTSSIPFFGFGKSDDGERFDELTFLEEWQTAPSGSRRTQEYTFAANERTKHIRLFWGDGNVGIGENRMLGVAFFLTATPTTTGTVARTDIENGLYDNAKVFVFLADYTDPYEDDEKLISGFVGDIELRDGTYIAQFMSKLDALSYRSGRKYQAACDAVFGSFRCGVHLNPHDWNAFAYVKIKESGDAASGTWVKPTTENGFYYFATIGGLVGASEPTFPTTAGATVSDGAVTWQAVRAFRINTTVDVVTDSRTLTINDVSADTNDTWAAGTIEFTSGVLKGVISTIRSQTAGVIVLSQALKNSPSVSDTAILTQGCRKRFTDDCKTKFDNGVNFQGFPFIPGAKIVGKFGGQE